MLLCPSRRSCLLTLKRTSPLQVWYLIAPTPLRCVMMWSRIVPRRGGAQRKVTASCIGTFAMDRSHYNANSMTLDSPHTRAGSTEVTGIGMTIGREGPNGPILPKKCEGKMGLPHADTVRLPTR